MATLTGGFLLDAAGTLFRSEKVWTIWSFLPAFRADFDTAVLGMLDSVMALAVLIAGPAIIAMFLTEFGLALTSRFAPQLQVFFMAMPLKSAVGTAGADPVDGPGAERSRPTPVSHPPTRSARVTGLLR